MGKIDDMAFLMPAATIDARRELQEAKRRGLAACRPLLPYSVLPGTDGLPFRRFPPQRAALPISGPPSCRTDVPVGEHGTRKVALAHLLQVRELTQARPAGPRRKTVCSRRRGEGTGRQNMNADSGIAKG